VKANVFSENDEAAPSMSDGGVGENKEDSHRGENKEASMVSPINLGEKVEYWVEGYEVNPKVIENFYDLKSRGESSVSGNFDLILS
jgi:hypothetical protein